MSNTPFTPENAAAAAVVSPSRPAGDASSPCAPPSDSHTPDTLSPNCRSPATREEEPPSSVPPQPPTAAAQPGTPTPNTQTPLAAPPTAAHSVTSHADPVKYARGPALVQRSNGPSLLTQALATARGIPRQHQNAPVSSQGSVEHQETASRQSDGTPLAPRFSPRKMAAMASSTTVCATAAPPAFGRLDLGEVNSMLNGHREFLVKAKDRAPFESADRESRVRDRPNRSRTYSHDTGQSSTLTSSLFVGSPTALHGEATDEHALPDARPQPRTWKTDHRVPMGPEKAWSIGSGDAANGQDGQVEKSITEVLAGVEPNARSRKASHSLRFFKEGLPEEKGKRKDSRVALPAREKSPSRGEKLAEIEEQPKSGEGTWAQGPADEREDRSRALPERTPEPYPLQESPEDYFLSKRVGLLTRDGVAKPALPGHEQSGQEEQVSVSAEPCAQLEPRHTFDACVNTGESAEEGDESGEEKISSAVFLPHQTPEQSQEHSPVSGVSQRTALSRKHSRHDDFHPWLVKADEPEVDNRENIERKVRSEAAEPPSLAPEVAFRQVEESAVPDECEPTALASHLPRPVSQCHDETAHDYPATPKQPLEAIELIPYKHQVGGHTTLWRFSRRAVCKQLNNRENEFYERIEKYHRDLLAFLPRYIGVLNVTFQKQPRRKSTMRRDDVAATERVQADPTELGTNGKANGTAQGEAAQKSVEAHASEPRPRMISQSIQSSVGQIPTVTFVDNQHILPRNLLQPRGSLPRLAGRFRSISASARGTDSCAQDGAGTGSREIGSRPSLHDRHANSWGATTVNKRLRNEVFNDAFLKQPIAIHRHRKGHQRRPVPRHSLQQVLRPSGSDPSLAESHGKRAQTVARYNEQATQDGKSLTQSQSDLGRGQEYSVEDDENTPKDVTGTSAPEPEILADSSPAQKKKRRYSGTGLRRKPKDVRDDRGDLKYFEEADGAGYKEVREGAAPDELQRTSPPRPEAAVENTNGTAEDQHAVATTPAGPPALPDPGPGFSKIPRPVNPKEAQTQRDSRVEYFLLLEDLTAGMRRPCIMDLKMGTRQYGVDANPKKQKSQQGKCAKTTSRELGVRVCGLQVWDIKTQSYVFKDKYYGRELKKGHEFQGALTRFLYDGVDPASILRHIPTVLQKLDELEVIIERLRGYRFYAASLLMFYDGDDSAELANGSSSALIDDSTTDFATDTEEAPRRTRRSRREIDFKMADFANCVTGGDLRDRPCPPKYPDEPDRGFLRGLKSLRRYFLKIQRDTRAEMGLGVVSALRSGGGANSESELDEDDGYVSE
ncbi:Inositol hexakisphosphate kinase 1 [Madurella mycetomatis]|uniref:Kinase n=1 Tax=Madurella mycetomatis TaxID=100816 RepID=A0A175VPV9_9PEZI|nr:Inositol hexakisphosphate kinase 1 [Madurella mycetomatis]